VATCRWVGSCVLRGLLALSTRPQTRGAATGGNMPVGRELRVRRAVSPLYAPPDPWRRPAFSSGRPCLWLCRVCRDLIFLSCVLPKSGGVGPHIHPVRRRPCRKFGVIGV